MTPENNAKAIEMHCTGRDSSAKIAAHLGVHPATVQRYLRGQGYELSQGRPMIHGATLRLIAEKREQGVSWADLESLMGFSGNQMRVRLKELPDRLKLLSTTGPECLSLTPHAPLRAGRRPLGRGLRKKALYLRSGAQRS